MSGYAATEVSSIFSPAVALRQVYRSLDFNGRSTRSEVIAYWFFAFLVAIAFYGFGTLVGIARESWLLTGISIVLAIPEPALFVRRLHDQDRTGWWGVLLVPYFGLAWFGGPRYARPAWEDWLIALLSFSILLLLLWTPTPDSNRYGTDPRLNPDEPVSTAE